MFRADARKPSRGSNKTLGQEITMPTRAKLRRAGLMIEGIVCLGPSLAYLLTGIFLLPHQLVLAVGQGVSESWFPVLYFVCAACLFVAVWRLYGELGMKSSPALGQRTTRVLLAFGLPALSLGPVGMFALARYEQVDAWLYIFFLVLPLTAVVHLVVATRSWLFGSPTSRSTRSRARTRAPG